MIKKRKPLRPETEDTGYFESIIGSETTGLPMYIYASCYGNGYECIIKVQTNHNKKINPNKYAKVSVEDLSIREGKLSDSDHAIVKDFIQLNKQVLLDHWSNKLFFSEDMINAIKPLKKTYK